MNYNRPELKNLFDGKPLKNIVDLKRGY